MIADHASYPGTAANTKIENAINALDHIDTALTVVAAIKSA